MDDYSQQPLYIQYNSGVAWALGIDSLEWQPGFCFNFKVYVFGLDWSPNVAVRLYFKNGANALSTTGLQCNAFD